MTTKQQLWLFIVVVAIIIAIFSVLEYWRAEDIKNSRPVLNAAADIPQSLKDSKKQGVFFIRIFLGLEWNGRNCKLGCNHLAKQHTKTARPESVAADWDRSFHSSKTPKIAYNRLDKYMSFCEPFCPVATAQIFSIFGRPFFTEYFALGRGQFWFAPENWQLGSNQLGPRQTPPQSCI